RYAAAGYRTCLVVQSQDRVADRLLGMRLTPSPQPVPAPAAAAAAASQPPLLCALRVETTKLLLAPLEIIKKADERLGITQGALAEVVGEELSVLPGMDAVMAVAVLERIARPAGGLLAFATSSGPRATSAGKKGRQQGSGWDVRGSRATTATGEWVYPWGEEEAEVVVFDGATTWEVLRMLASPEKARWYLRRFRTLAERTDIGRVALPSVARLLDSIVGSSKGGGAAGGALPSVARLLDSIVGSSKGGSIPGAAAGSGGEDGQRSKAEIWEKLDCFLSVSRETNGSSGSGLRGPPAGLNRGLLQRGSAGGAGGGGSAGGGGKDGQRSAARHKAVSAFADPYRTSVFLLADAASHSSVDTCRRIWGCAVQAGVSPSGVFLLPSDVASGGALGGLAEKFSPLPVAELPVVSEEAPAAVAAAAGQMSDGAVAVMNGEGAGKAPPAWTWTWRRARESINHMKLWVFDKQEVKLQQASRLASKLEGRGRAAGRGGGPEAVCGAASSCSGEVEAGWFLPGVGSLPTNRLPPGLNSAVAAAAAAASSSSPAATLNSALSGLQSSFNGQITSLDELLKKSLEQISAALSSNASADAALQAQISALKANLAALNGSLASLNALNISGSNLNFTDLISQISGIRSNISSISSSIAALNKDLAGIIGSGAGSGVGSRVGPAALSSAAATAASASRSAAIRAAVRQRLAAVTQRVAGLNGNVSALAGMLNALNGALNGGGVNSGLVADVANLLPQQAGMLHAVLTSCNGLLSLQAGAADIQILKIGSDYLLTYYLYAAGVTKAPDSQAIFKGNACSTAAASAALALPGTWVPMSPVSWSLANVVRASAADVADVLASFQGITNDDLMEGTKDGGRTCEGVDAVVGEEQRGDWQQAMGHWQTGEVAMGQTHAAAGTGARGKGEGCR
ncbi:unnamed protein product, partial [Closterium sp. Naga37s-1]